MSRVMFAGWLAALCAGSLVAVGACSAADGLKVGDKAPAFKAMGADGKEVSLAALKEAKAVVVCFTCNNCPVAVAYEDRFSAFAKEYAGKGVAFVALNCNWTESLDELKSRAAEKKFPYVYAMDESGASARDYGAQVTPHLYVLDSSRNVAYIGAFDDSQDAPKTAHVKNAVDALLKGEKPPVQSTRAFGCGIKIKK